MISSTLQTSLNANSFSPLVSHQCKDYSIVSINLIKEAKVTYHAVAMIVSSQLDRLDNTLHKVLPLGQPEMAGTFSLTSKAAQNVTAGVNP